MLIPTVVEAAARGHALFAAQNGIDDVSQAAARTELGNNRLIDNSRPTPDGGLPIKKLLLLSPKEIKRLVKLWMKTQMRSLLEQ